MKMRASSYVMTVALNTTGIVHLTGFLTPEEPLEEETEFSDDEADSSYVGEEESSEEESSEEEEESDEEEDSDEGIARKFTRTDILKFYQNT